MVAGPLRNKLPSSSDAPDIRQLAREARAVHERRQRGSGGDEALSAAKFFIPSLPGQPAKSSMTMYAGHLPSEPVIDGIRDNDSDAHLFFFLVRSKHIADAERTIFWFNGGPGCSSFDGALMETGPFRLAPGSKGELVEAEGAWNEYANVVFIDQPVGTGYSYAATNKYVHELKDAGAQVVQFMTNFYSVFPEFAKQDTWLAGESYAGQYIPYIADAILKAPRLPTKLKGLIIGNGWIDPYNQYPAYLEFAVKAGVVKEGSDTETKVRKQVDECRTMLDAKEMIRVHNGQCEDILTTITDSTVQSVNGQNMCVNNYDVRLTDTHPACGMNWPPDLADITPWLQRDDVKSAFHATRKEGGWVECNGQVGANFWAMHSAPSITMFESLLEKVPMLLFAGDQDLICNHVGIERMIEALEWGGSKGFGDAAVEDWSVAGKHAGTWTSARNLTYVKVADASHMVPYDQPLASHDMLLRFLGVSLLGAAGPAAQVPSKVGDEQEAVLGETHPNGTAVTNGPGVALSGQDSETKEAGSSSASGGDGFEPFEALANVGSALIILALMAIGLFAFFMVRKRINRRRGPGGALSHGRKASLGRGQAVPQESDDHELEELVEEDEEDFVDEDLGPDDKDRRIRDEEANVFGIGSDDEDDTRRHRRGAP